MYIQGLGFHEIGGVPFGGPYNKYYSILGAYVGVPLWGSENKDCSIWGSTRGDPAIYGNYHVLVSRHGGPSGTLGYAGI